MRPLCAQAECAVRVGRRVVASAGQCRGPLLGRLSASMRALESHVAALCRAPRHDTKIVSRPSLLPRVVSRRLPRVLQRPCAVSQGTKRRIAAPVFIVSRHKVAPQPRYKVLYRYSLPGQAMRVRAAARPARRPTVL